MAFGILCKNCKHQEAEHDINEAQHFRREELSFPECCDEFNPERELTKEEDAELHPSKSF